MTSADWGVRIENDEMTNESDEERALFGLNVAQFGGEFSNDFWPGGNDVSGH